MTISSMNKSIILELLFVIITVLDSFNEIPHVVVCTQDEKNALLILKKDLKDPSNRLSSWVPEDDDYCQWIGVVCHSYDSHVSELHLQNPHHYQDYTTEDDSQAYKRTQLGGQINPSLLNLKHLVYLDLSENDFGGIPIPSFLGSLVSLRHLNLSRAGFGGIIPRQIGNLSMLQYLDLRVSGDYFLDVENLHWLSDHLSLQHLDLSGVSLKTSPNWMQVINSFHSLAKLYLSNCELDYPSTSVADVNFTSLLVLDLSKNNFNMTSFEWISSLENLVSLDMERNNLEGPIPIGLESMTKLRSLDLSWNGINGTIPEWLYSLNNLNHLDLSSNALQGNVSSAVKNLTSIVFLDLSTNELEGTIPVRSFDNLCNLKVLRLSGNDFVGDISELIQTLSACTPNHLEYLQLYGNRLSGHLTDQLGQLKNLEFLDLSLNKVSGPIPQILGNLSKLETLLINDNLFQGVLSEAHLLNLTNLKLLRANQNQLVLNISDPDWIPPFQLQYLELRSCQLGPLFPVWIQSQKNLVYLDLSQAQISDKIPDWFWNFSATIGYMNLSHNQINGKITYLPKFDAASPSVYLASNQFSGSLPRISSNITSLDLSNNLFSGELSHFLCDNNGESNHLNYLNLEKNLLSGDIPNCWMSWSELGIIKLGKNNLSGVIPSSIGNITWLSSLHLRTNSLSGELPSSMQNCTKLIAIDLGENKFSGKIPNWLGNGFQNLMILGLRSNEFSGEIPSELCELQDLQILDLANNQISGKLPSCLKNLTAMTVKQTIIQRNPCSLYYDDIYDNAFVFTKGREVEYDIILSLVTIMDMSNNNISGEIPKDLTNLRGLLFLNLSRNHLTGKIPEDISTMALLESIDFSANQLSGEIPPSMSGMTFLSHFNISYNNISGKIPLSTQFQSFDSSSFTGNAELCGAPLTKNCSNNGLGRPDSVDEEEEDGDGNFEMKGFYLSMVIGFVTSFACVCGPLLFSRSWRRAYYQFLDDGLYQLSLLFRRCT